MTNKQFDDLLKEMGGLPEGMNLDPELLAVLRQATNAEFNKVAKEKYGDVPEGSDDDEEQQTSEQNKEQQQSSSSKST